VRWGHPADLPADEIDIAVVIDVLRATTTATVLLSREIAELRVAATPANLGSLSRDAVIVFSELGSVSESFRTVDNSPHVAKTVPFEGRLPVLVTTNGTRAIKAAWSRARRVFLASFLNLDAVADLLLRLRGNVTLLPCGSFSRRAACEEDDLCAAALDAALRGARGNVRDFADKCWNAPGVRKRLASNPGLSEDCKLAFSTNLIRVVPEVVAESAEGLLTVRPCLD